MWIYDETEKPLGGFMRAVGRSESLLDNAERGEEWSGAGGEGLTHNRRTFSLPCVEL